MPPPRQGGGQRGAVADRKLQRGEPRAGGDIGRLRAEMVAERGRVHHLDVAARRRCRDAARCGFQVPHAGECRQKDMMVGRILGDQHHGGDAHRRCWHAAGTPDSRNSPDSAAGRCKADLRRLGLAREGKREADLHRREPSGRLPSRSNVIASEAAIPDARNAAASAAASSFQGSTTSLRGGQEDLAKAREQHRKIPRCRVFGLRRPSAAR